MTKAYYNTNGVSGQTLLAFEQRNSTQEAMVLTVYQFAMRPLAWFEVERLLVEDMNACSIKRSITNLKSKGILVKTSNKVQGVYGKVCYQYQLNPKT